MADANKTRLINPFGDMPTDYLRAKELALQLSDDFYRQLSDSLTSSFNAHLRSLPHSTIAEKQALASWCNQELRELGLCIRCPSTGKSAILCADWRDPDRLQGRFRLTVREGHGRIKRTGAWLELPALELMRAPQRVEPFSHWKRDDRRER